MNQQETGSIMTIALMAAFADGAKDESERAAVKQLGETLDPEGTLNLAALYREVLLGGVLNDYAGKAGVSRASTNALLEFRLRNSDYRTATTWRRAFGRLTPTRTISGRSSRNRAWSAGYSRTRWPGGLASDT
mgnify:CR=1 FL=1